MRDSIYTQATCDRLDLSEFQQGSACVHLLGAYDIHLTAYDHPNMKGTDSIGVHTQRTRTDTQAQI